MGRLQTATSVTTTTTEQVTLKPSQRRRLLTNMQTHAKVCAEIKTLEGKKEKAAAAVRAVREETGANSLTLDGYTTTNVQGTTTSLDKEKLVELGCALAWIEEATVTKPKKAYEKITAPGSREK